MKAMKKELGTGAKPANVYNEFMAQHSADDNPSYLPKNPKQAANAKYRLSTDTRVSDPLLSVAALHNEVPNYIRHMTALPYFAVVAGEQNLLQLVNWMIELHPRKLLLSYDTGFSVLDTLFSALVVKLPVFKDDQAPTVAPIIIVHDRKLGDVHKIFWEVVREALPALRTTRTACVFDGEVGLRKAVPKVLPKVKILGCWNHLRNDIKNWLNDKRHRTESTDLQWDVERLLNSQSEREFLDLEARLIEKTRWTYRFTKYYQRTLRPSIMKFCGRWILGKHYSPASGVTQNQSESTNATLRRLFEGKRAGLLSCLIGYLVLSVARYNELARSLMGAGRYKVLPKYASLRRNWGEYPLQRVFDSDKLMRSIVGGVGGMHEEFVNVVVGAVAERLIEARTANEEEQKAQEGSDDPKAGHLEESEFQKAEGECKAADESDSSSDEVRPAPALTSSESTSSSSDSEIQNDNSADDEEEAVLAKCQALGYVMEDRKDGSYAVTNAMNSRFLVQFAGGQALCSCSMQSKCTHIAFVGRMVNKTVVTDAVPNVTRILARPHGRKKKPGKRVTRAERIDQKKMDLEQRKMNRAALPLKVRKKFGMRRAEDTSASESECKAPTTTSTPAPAAAPSTPPDIPVSTISAPGARLPGVPTVVPEPSAAKIVRVPGTNTVTVVRQSCGVRLIQ
jgi:hypothetical protein